MKNRSKKLICIALTAIATIHTASCFADSTSPIPEVSDGFRFSITPYLWLAGLSGNVDYANGKSVHSDLNANKVLSNLSIGFMADGEVHYGRFGVMGNAIFAKLSNSGSKSYLKDDAITVSSTTDAWMGIYTAAGTYTAYADPNWYVDVLAGARFLNLNSKTQLDLSINPIHYTKGKTLYSQLSSTDAIGGFKGRYRLVDSNFYIPFYVDAGGGSSTAKFTSQQALGVGYAFSYADISLVYNNLYYSMSNDKASSYVNMSGPAIAATFRF
jgi:hypothetical protein